MVVSSKVSLRRHIKTLLRAMSASQLAYKSECLFEKFTSSEDYKKCRHLSVYLNTAREPDTLPIIKDALSHGKHVYVPQIIPEQFRSVSALQGNDSGMCMHRIVSIEQIDHWPVNRYNIREPPAPEKWDEVNDDAVERGQLDLIIVPGVAFTYSNHRLGRGGGFYDRYLHWLREHTKLTGSRFPKLVALAFSEQMVDELPIEAHDIVMDRVIFA